LREKEERVNQKYREEIVTEKEKQMKKMSEKERDA
jgi:hypothetical protein